MYAKDLVKACSVDGHVVTFARLQNRLWFDRDLGGPDFRAKQWMDRLNEALVRANCTTVNRVAMFLAQIGAESGSFRYTEELADGSAYNWRSDLGNNHPFDGERFKGRTYIQITGRHNYTALSAWAFAHGYVPTKTFFVDHPERLADVDYIFLGPVWYWTVARNMNAYADRGDIEGATRAVNGGLNNLSGRTLRWNHARTLGRALLPYGIPAPKPVVKKPVAPKPVPPKHAVRPKPVVRPLYVTVHRNESLSLIATRNRTTWQKLQRLNNLANPNYIRIGQRLRVR